MDSNALREDGALPGKKRDKDAGTSYLRELKVRNGEGQGAVAAQTECEPSPPKRERRRAQRYDCAGKAEVRTGGDSARLWGTLKDISLNGCYVEMTTTFPVDTQVYVALEASGIRTLAEAVVRTSYPALGMGLCFTTLAPTQQGRLQEILAAAADERSAGSVGWRP